MSIIPLVLLRDTFDFQLPRNFSECYERFV
jgi:hypothetical protein